MIFGLSELLLTLTRRAHEGDASRDRHSLALIWVVILAAIVLGVVAAYRLKPWGMVNIAVIRRIAYGAFSLGMALRWYSVIYLGKYFTVNVSIAGDHRLVETGPYRFVRHPSYLGMTLALAGFALSMVNWVSLVLVMVPWCAVMLWRISIEEKALNEGLGEAYGEYAQRTWRLVPLLY
jgi:protein-S-isoprenylcysteine O-methyltransferase Ste14